MSNTANILLHHSRYYRAQVFGKGLAANGYRIISDRNYSPKAGDVLLIWNRNPPQEKTALIYEAAGGTVIVAENGYLGDTKALAKWHHSGAGEWYVGPDNRFTALGIDVKPWRTGGGHILVLPQRSIGEKGVAMPRNWLNNILPRLSKLTDRPIIVRHHPGKNPAKPLEVELEEAWAAVTWASGAGLKAICAGIPVFHDYADWVGGPAATCTFDLENPYLGDRTEMLHRLAWAQWSWEEIESGEAFKCLL